MPDIVSPDVRSRMMAGIRGRNTKPELTLRRSLHAAGFRFRLHDRTLPGKPDIVFPRYRAVLFAHGCFWHGHSCRHGKNKPKNNASYWEKKIQKNTVRDERNLLELGNLGWKALLPLSLLNLAITVVVEFVRGNIQF